MIQDWLKNLKVGDYVFINGRSGKKLTIVQRITPTGRVVVNNIRFVGGVNRSNGRDIIVLEEATEEAIGKYKAVQFIRAVKLAMNNARMTYGQAKEIDKILNLGIGEYNDAGRND